MSRKNTTLRERVRALEVEVKNLRRDIKTHGANVRELSNHISEVQTTLVKVDGRFDTLSTQLSSLEESLNNAPSGLKRRDKVAIALALISSITSIVIVLIQTFA